MTGVALTKALFTRARGTIQELHRSHACQFGHETRRAAGVSEVPIDGDQFGRETADVSELLALPGLRRGLEPQPAFKLDAALVAEVTPAGVTEIKSTLHQLVELIEAIDRRLPQVERAGETTIANAAMRLRIEAQKRIDELEREVASRESVDPRPRMST